MPEISDWQCWIVHQRPPTLPRIEKGGGQAADTRVLEAGGSVSVLRSLDRTRPESFSLKVFELRSSLLLFSHIWLFATSWTATHQTSLSFIISQSLLKLMSIESVMPSNHLILCHPHPLLLLPSVFPIIRIFSNESVFCISWPKYWSFSISPSNEYSGLLSFRIDWFDLLAVQRTPKNLLQHN